MSISNFGENAILDAIFNNAALQEANRYLQLHTGDPSEAGTSNVATENTRKAITGAAAVGGVFTSVNDLEWTNVAASEQYTHASVWDDPTAGNCYWTGPLVANAVVAGDDFTIPAGSLTVSLD